MTSNSAPAYCTYCLLFDEHFASHLVICIAVSESSRQKVSAQEEAGNVDVEKIKREARQEAQEGANEKEGEELRRPRRENKTYGKSRNIRREKDDGERATPVRI